MIPCVRAVYTALLYICDQYTCLYRQQMTGGRYMGHRVWRGGIVLGATSWVSGDTALGTLTDEEGVIKVVRVRFREE